MEEGGCLHPVFLAENQQAASVHCAGWMGARKDEGAYKTGNPNGGSRGNNPANNGKDFLLKTLV